MLFRSDQHLLTRPAATEFRDRLLADLNFLKQQSEQSGWFDPSAETVNESEILLPDGKIFRPDRLLLKHNEAIVIDYKTGDEDASHALQVKKYAAVLQQMGYSKTSLFLVYPMLKKSVEVAA